MTQRQPERGPDGGPDRLRLTQPGPLTSFGLVGLVIGWAVRPLVLQLGGNEPTLSWAPAVLIGFAALSLGGVAWATRRALAKRHGLEPHRAVNRMVLGKSSALVGAALFGYYVGRGIGQLGITAELSGSRLLHAGIAAVVALVMTGAALALERACLVSSEEDDDLPS